ncbi:hypothetical protein ACI65C_001772 [Semiaphis heraclei]
MSQPMWQKLQSAVFTLTMDDWSLDDVQCSASLYYYPRTHNKKIDNPFLGLVYRFVCSNGCGRSYKYKKGLDRHLQFECGVEPQFECLVCVPRFMCSNGCGRSYKYKKGVNQHLRYECGVPPMLKCSFCDKMFRFLDCQIVFCCVFCFRSHPCVVLSALNHTTNDYTYEEHLLRRAAAAMEAKQRIMCPNKCGRSYKRLEHMKRHIAYECGIDPKYECYVCRRKFVYNFSMKKHMIQMHKDVIDDPDTAVALSHLSASTSHGVPDHIQIVNHRSL